jgi:hypothetical protein
MNKSEFLIVFPGTGRGVTIQPGLQHIKINVQKKSSEINFVNGNIFEISLILLQIL